MKKIHYTEGYGGKLNYTTMCGKEIRSHSKTEDATVDPKVVNCKKCLATKEWKEDHEDGIGEADNGIRRRIYIESDILHADELRNAQITVVRLCDKKSVKYVRRVFSEVLDFAWHDLEKTWESVKKSR